MQIELIEVSLSDGNEILEMIREIGPGENGFGNAGYDMLEGEFVGYLATRINESNGTGIKPGLVPQTTYWLIIDHKPVGLGKVRHYLNDNLRKIGGHIGYCIRPGSRGKGFGNIILKELIEKAKEKNIPKALLTCLETNSCSRKIIEKNGGKLERIEQGECYYWIRLDMDNGIHEIHIDDYNEIYDLWSRTPGMGLSSADSYENILNFLSRNKGMSFCYKENGVIIGTILSGNDGRRGYIYHVTVSERYRGRGIGGILVDKSLQKQKDEGISKCQLSVFKDNEIGNAFWDASGWTKRGDIFVYCRNL